MSEQDGIDIQGRCYCGAVEFRVQMPAADKPIFTAYCHCDSCRRAHSAALYQVVVVEERHFTITAGADEVQPFSKEPGRMVRAFCRTCGSKVLNRFPNWRPGGRVPVGFFPSLLDEQTQRDLPQRLRPQRVNQVQGCVLDFDVLQAAMTE